MALGLTIPGGSGPSLVFTVKGQSAQNWTTDFSNALLQAQASGTLVINPLSPAKSADAGAKAGGTTTLNEIIGNTATGTYNLPAVGGQYLADVSAVATTVNGSAAGGDTVVGISYVTYNAAGGNDNVTFVQGENVFNGSAASGDTVTGGEGFDTINTGSGNTTVFSGAGGTTINLNDTASGGDLTYLGDGHATVNANGLYDNVVTGNTGQLIIGGSVASSILNVVLESTVAGAPGNDTVVAGAGTTNVFDLAGGNTIYGGSGTLNFIGQAGTSTIADTITAGSGQVVAFGASNDDITLANASGQKVIVGIAGGGNETLNAANAAGGVELFGGSDSTASDTLVGGNYYNYIQNGSGTEAITGGTGENIFNLTTVTGGGAHITIFDFAAGAQNFVEINDGGNSASDLANATVSNGNLTITLSDNTTVTFIGVTSLTGHTV